jgi:pseudaminic acid biosynthesis-associated methylase
MSGARPRGRLEELWAGEFGDAYIERNLDAARGRGEFWRTQVETLGVESALEVGCNIGGNLSWIAELIGPENVAGVDVNPRALELLKERIPGARVEVAAGRELPLPDDSFDLVFTMGVLIHQDPSEVGEVMAEIVRCARRYVICGEYYAEELTEVPYRGQEGALFKQDYGALYGRLFPKLELVDEGFLSPRDGRWDDLSYWVFKLGTDAPG